MADARSGAATRRARAALPHNRRRRRRRRRSRRDEAARARAFCDRSSAATCLLLRPSSAALALVAGRSGPIALDGETATTEGWTDTLFATVDAVGVGAQPVQDANPAWVVFFVLFMIFGACLVLNLFIGVLLANFAKKRAQVRFRSIGRRREARVVVALNASVARRRRPRDARRRSERVVCKSDDVGRATARRFTKGVVDERNSSTRATTTTSGARPPKHPLVRRAGGGRGCPPLRPRARSQIPQTRHATQQYRTWPPPPR